ncbi:hypothetical protein EV701_107225 [Chthoniobacter flavus]|nr:hypothetical protein EV701_107225 [Chthoniobacter flavus]
MPSSSLAEPEIASPEALDELIAAVADLQSAAEHELRDRREWLSRELASVEAELADLAEESPVEEKPQPKETTDSVRKLTLPELIAVLEAAPERTLNIRKAHFDVKSVKALAKANPQRLQLGGKGGWPTVTLVELSDPPLPETPAKESPQGTFSFGEALAGSRKKKRKPKK